MPGTQDFFLGLNHIVTSVPVPTPGSDHRHSEAAHQALPGRHLQSHQGMTGVGRSLDDEISHCNSLGTIKASQVVVLNESSVVVTQRKLMLTAI